MRIMRISLATQEGRSLFHIGVRVDRALRKLAIAALQQKLPTDRYRFLSSQVEDAVTRYRQFLDRLFQGFSTSQDRSSAIKIFPHIENYKGLLRSIREVGTHVPARVSTKNGEDIFKLVRSTDLCIRICETYAFLHLERALQIRLEVQEQIRLLQLSEKDCSQDLAAVLAHERQLRKKRGTGKKR